MPRKLREEIKQTKPFGTLEQEALLNLERTTAVLRHWMAEELKQHGLTGPQYNALRILRGSQPAGLCRHEIACRLVTPVPDVTRLLDRLQDAGLIARERSDEDRRLVRTRITRRGLDVLAKLDDPVAALHSRQLGHMNKAELRQLIALLERARDSM
jgi:DNA-binding MarR family transcriptional regulator